MKKYSVLGVNITVANYQEVINKIIRAAKKSQYLTVAPIASHPIMLANKNKAIKKILNSFNIVLPDSQYVKWALNYLYNLSIKDRIYGPKLFLEVCKQAEENKTKIFLYGNNIKPLKKNLLEKFPKLQLHGLDLSYRKISIEKDCIFLINALTDSKAKILVIGLGSPLQHKVAYRFKNINMPIVMVGAAFDFVSGIKPQAPKWMQNSGLEWLFRLLHEPKRLWKRYLYYGSIFILLVLQKKLKLMFKWEIRTNYKE
jgi:N-acetylglucosaminyldiphosphoundecaprenol N-acetyl-beta-D-mannosaminyltransferase